MTKIHDFFHENHSLLWTWCVKKKSKFNNLEKLSYFLEMQLREIKGEIFIHKIKYVSDVLKTFQMLSCNLVSIDTRNKFNKS